MSYAEILPIWWSMTWRGVLAGTVAGALAGAIAGFLAAVLGSPDAAGSWGAIVWLLTGAALTWLYMTVRRVIARRRARA